MSDTDAPPFVDPLPLAQALIQRPSVTPADAGALDLLQGELEKLGFRAKRYKFGEVDNLYARLGDAAPNFLFAGHTDVVPPGDGWARDPFSGAVEDGVLHGRGASDMKAAIAAMVTGVESFLAQHGKPNGSISFLITGDEEGPCTDGTQRVLPILAAEGERFDHCLVGEPTSATWSGDCVKNGRRGSLNCVITMEGAQGHVAYPKQAKNPVTPLLMALGEIKARGLDDGAPGFQPSNLEVTTIDVGNPTHNIIPARASAKLNIRFNTAHTGDDLCAWLQEIVERHAQAAGAKANIDSKVTGHPFYTKPCAFTDNIVASAREHFRVETQLSTSGGTSDARFIKDYCPVAELGLLNTTAHKVDENVAVEDVRKLARCYADILGRYFAA